MSQFTEPRIVRAYMSQRVDGAIQRADEQRLLRRARAHWPRQQAWRHRLILGVGRGLIAMGERLAAYGLTPPLTLEEQVGSGRPVRPLS
jgi:hypothetical protein